MQAFTGQGAWNDELQLTWKAHDICVYSLVCDENRLFSSSSHGEIKEWDPETGKFRQMTILEVSIVSLLDNAPPFL